MKLTRQTIDTIRLPRGRKDLIVFDSELPGFGIRIRAGGSKKWVVQYQLHGHQQRRVTIGSVAVFNPEEARRAARAILAKARLGQDPQEERREEAEQSRLTLKAVVDRYLAIKQDKLRPTSMRNARGYLLRHWKPLHKKPLHLIERRDVAAYLGGAPVAAARARDRLSAMFAWAIAEGLCDRNPTIGTHRPDEGVTARDRVLDDRELAAVWRAAEDDHGVIVKLLVLTGCRRQEVGGMQWGELNLGAGTWTIPSERSKNKRAHTLALPPLAWSIIGTVERRPGIDFLFGRKVGFTAWLKKAALDKRAGIAPWTIHDLRRSVATGMANLGVQPHVIEAVLNHQGGAKRGIAGVYNRSSYEREARAALALWADHMRALVDGGERKIIPMRS